MASPRLSIPLLTAEEYFDLAPVGRTELVRGEVVCLSPSGNRHGRLAAFLVIQVGTFVAQHALGEVYTADAGFVLFRAPDTVRAPDVAFVRRERIPPEGLPDGFFPGPPDLAIEVVSPSDRWQDVEEKVLEYLDAGTAEVWVVDPRQKLVQVCIRTEKRILRGEDVLTSPLLPGFSLPLESLFT